MGNVPVTVGTLALGGTDDARPPASAVRAAIPGSRGPGMTAAACTEGLCSAGEAAARFLGAPSWASSSGNNRTVHRDRSTPSGHPGSGPELVQQLRLILGDPNCPLLLRWFLQYGSIVRSRTGLSSHPKLHMLATRTVECSASSSSSVKPS